MVGGRGGGGGGQKPYRIVVKGMSALSRTRLLSRYVNCRCTVRERSLNLLKRLFPTCLQSFLGNAAG